MTTFLRLAPLSEKDGTVRKGFVTLGGQMLNRRTPVKENVLVKAAPGRESLFQRERSNGITGSIYYTDSLKPVNGCYSARDIQPVSRMKEDKDTRKRLLWERWRADNLNYPFRRGYTAQELITMIKELGAYFCLNSGFSVSAYNAAGTVCDELYSDSGTLTGLRLTITELHFDLTFVPEDGKLLPEEKVSVTLCDNERHTSTIGIDFLPSMNDDACQIIRLLERIYRITFLITEESHRTVCLLGADDSKVIETGGIRTAFTSVCWPEVQDLFGRKGFRKHSILMEAEDYEKFGDSAYWVDYRWLYPSKHKAL